MLDQVGESERHIVASFLRSSADDALQRQPRERGEGVATPSPVSDVVASTVILRDIASRIESGTPMTDWPDAPPASVSGIIARLMAGSAVAEIINAPESLTALAVRYGMAARANGDLYLDTATITQQPIAVLANGFMHPAGAPHDAPASVVSLTSAYMAEALILPAQSVETEALPSAESVVQSLQRLGSVLAGTTGHQRIQNRAAHDWAAARYELSAAVATSFADTPFAFDPFIIGVIRQLGAVFSLTEHQNACFAGTVIPIPLTPTPVVHLGQACRAMTAEPNGLAPIARIMAAHLAIACDMIASEPHSTLWPGFMLPDIGVATFTIAVATQAPDDMLAAAHQYALALRFAADAMAAIGISSRPDAEYEAHMRTAAMAEMRASSAVGSARAYLHVMRDAEALQTTPDSPQT